MRRKQWANCGFTKENERWANWHGRCYKQREGATMTEKKTPTCTDLPGELPVGLPLLTHTGTRVEVAKVRERDDGESLYWLRYKSGIVGHRAWTRDELVAEGCILG